MRQEDKKGETRSHTVRPILHFLSGRLGAHGGERLIVRKRILFGAVLAFALAADLITKWAAFRFLGLNRSVSVIPGFFDLRCVWNPGIVFGARAPAWVTIAVSIVATTVIIWYLATRRGSPPVVQIYLGLILSGVIGNLYDRAAFGAVRDFIELYVGKYHWPNFNLADAFILIGVVLAMIQFILTEDKKKAKSVDKAENGNKRDTENQNSV